MLLGGNKTCNVTGPVSKKRSSRLVSEQSKGNRIELKLSAWLEACLRCCGLVHPSSPSTTGPSESTRVPGGGRTQVSLTLPPILTLILTLTLTLNLTRNRLLAPSSPVATSPSVRGFGGASASTRRPNVSDRGTRGQRPCRCIGGRVRMSKEQECRRHANSHKCT